MSVPLDKNTVIKF